MSAILNFQKWKSLFEQTSPAVKPINDKFLPMGSTPAAGKIYYSISAMQDATGNQSNAFTLTVYPGGDANASHNLSIIDKPGFAEHKDSGNKVIPSSLFQYAVKTGQKTSEDRAIRFEQVTNPITKVYELFNISGANGAELGRSYAVFYNSLKPQLESLPPAANSLLTNIYNATSVSGLTVTGADSFVTYKENTKKKLAQG